MIKSPRACSTPRGSSLKKIARPQLEDSVGWIIQITDDDGDVHIGTVTAFDIKKKSVQVIFTAGGEDDVEEIPFKSSEIMWVSGR